VVNQDLGLLHRVEQLRSEKLIAKPSIGRLGKAVLPLGPLFDVGRARAGALTTAHGQ